MKSKTRSALYDHACEYCDAGWVRCEIHARELIRVTKSEYVALEKVPVGVCDRCKARYYSAGVLKQAEGLHRKGGPRKVNVPVARYVVSA